MFWLLHHWHSMRVPVSNSPPRCKGGRAPPSGTPPLYLGHSGDLRSIPSGLDATPGELGKTDSHSPPHEIRTPPPHPTESAPHHPIPRNPHPTTAISRGPRDRDSAG